MDGDRTAREGPHVVTLGGGHGQAALLEALIPLACRITAIVSVADDGGCSGKLRQEAGMPPPGDLRRCLTTLARNRRLAERFELRLTAEHSGRSAGNLALSEAFREFGSLQKAVDWAADLLECRGRVVPVAETGGVLSVYDLGAGGIVEGETNVEDRTSQPLVAIVNGPDATNPAAREALADADLICIGPGSFITSTLAAITTADVAKAIVASPARRVFIQNLAPEPGQTDGFATEDFVRMVRDHLVIGSHGEQVSLDVLRDRFSDDEAYGVSSLPDGSVEVVADLARGGEAVHDTDKLGFALIDHFGLQHRIVRSLPVPPDPQTEQSFEERLLQARLRLKPLPTPDEEHR